jgi:hypothetical protein
MPLCSINYKNWENIHVYGNMFISFSQFIIALVLFIYQKNNYCKGAFEKCLIFCLCVNLIIFLYNLYSRNKKHIFSFKKDIIKFIIALTIFMITFTGSVWGYTLIVIEAKCSNVPGIYNTALSLGIYHTVYVFSTIAIGYYNNYYIKETVDVEVIDINTPSTKEMVSISTDTITFHF